MFVGNDYSAEQPPFWLQPSSRQVWIQAIGRALYQAGYGLIQFYIPLVFVNQVGLSATSVGIGIGSGALAGLLGHLLGGYLADSRTYGRKRALLFSGGLSILATLVLALTQNLPMLVVANLILGLSAGCYWTAADAAVIDATTIEQRHKAFAILSLADNLGGGIGVLGGGVLLTLVEQAQTLFLGSSLILLVFLVLIQAAVTETRQSALEQSDTLQGFVVALKDQSLRLFILSNILFTTFIALIGSTLPLYFTNVISTAEAGTSPLSVANLFTWCYIGFGAVLQLPIVQVLGSLLRVQVLMISMVLWGVGFFLVWATGMVVSMQFICMIAALCMLSVATAVYKPFAPTIVSELAPESLRGVYLAISYQCWSIGYFVGPIVGGWAMDQPHSVAQNSWLGAAISTVGGLVILHFLGQSRFSNRSTLTTEDQASAT